MLCIIDSRKLAWIILVGIASTVGWSRYHAASEQSAKDTLEHRFTTKVQPFLANYCFGCHGATKPKAMLDLTRELSVAGIVRNMQHWETVVERLEANEMPPEDAKKQPGKEERAAVIAWLRELRDREADKNAGDPGVVLARRLSNAEYDYTIRDLTGVDIRPTREFPVDPANEAGFDNTGESLTMSPALLKKYLAAARHVAEHIVFNPEGFVFAPHPVVTETDRDKYCVQRILDFYQRHRPCRNCRRTRRRRAICRCRSCLRVIERTRRAPAATSASTRSASPSKASAPSANAVQWTWEAARLRLPPLSPMESNDPDWMA